MIPFIMGDNASGKYPNKRHHDAIAARPAAAGVQALRSKHSFKPEMGDEARRNMFRHLDEKTA
jgi:GSH-dependent disulfide-bond oxidoreductase